MAGDLIVYQGTSLHVQFDVTDESNTALPLKANGYTAAALQARKRVNDADPVIDASTATGELDIEPDDATGEIHLDLGANVTAQLAGGIVVYDCLAWNPTDTTDVILIASGRISVKKRVTAKP